MRKRNLSEFMCIEMLYDYKSGKLDPLRQQAVEEGMEGSPRVREELRKLNAGINFCDQLKETAVEDSLIQYILNQPKQTEKLISQFKWKGLPQPVRWAIEAVVVAVAISLFVIQTPRIFHRFTRVDESGLIVKKFDIPATGGSTAPDATTPEAAAVEITQTDVPQVTAKKEIAPAKNNPTPTLVTAPIVAQTAKPAPLQNLVALPTAVTPPPTVAPIVNAPVKKVVTQAEEKPAATPAKKGNAYLYRMVMQSSDLDVVSPKISALVQSLGGEKAGDVELGWRRKGGSYFHFSLPLVNNQAFQEGLKKIGIFSIVKTPHPRVMPEDTERFILWVEEKTPSAAEQKDQSDAQTDDEDSSGADNKDTDAQ